MKKKVDKNNLCEKPTAHCLVLPWPSLDYTISMLQFCKRLKEKGITITLVLPNYVCKWLRQLTPVPFAVETISDFSSKAITQLLLKKNKKKYHNVDCIMYSSLFPWALDVAKEFGLVGAAFFSESCALNSIYYHIHDGQLNVVHKGSKIMVEGLPVLEHQRELSYLSEYRDFYREEIDTYLNQFVNFNAADWLFCNTFYELEDRVIDSMQKKVGRFRPIGPHIPSTYLDKRLKYDKNYGRSNTYMSESWACIKWLQKQPVGSVVYISLQTALQWDQISELAWGIKRSKKRFLWMISEDDAKYIPKEFVQETKKKGLIVSWCSQVEVLAQSSVGCFMSNCDWNSVLEAISLGVPMVAMPGDRDQHENMNAKFVTDVWKTGVLAEKKVEREVVEGCIKEVMKGERAWKMKENAHKWREKAKAAVDEGGSSDRNISEFVASLIQY